MSEKKTDSRRQFIKKASSGIIAGTGLGAVALSGTEPTKAGRGKEKAYCEDFGQGHKVCVYRPTTRVYRGKAPTNRRIFVGNAKIYLYGNSPSDFNLHVGSWMSRRGGKRYYHAWIWESKLLNQDIHIRAPSPRKLAQRVGSVVSKWLYRAWRLAKGPLRKGIARLIIAGVGVIISIVLSPFLS